MRSWILPLASLAVGCNGLASTPGPLRGPQIVEVGGSAMVDFAHPPGTTLVTLRARRSFYSRTLGIHPWFLVYDPERDRWETWEIWVRDQEPEEQASPMTRHFSDGREPQADERVVRWHGTIRHVDSFGYAGDWAFDDVALAQWSGAEAERLLRVLRTPDEYPYRDVYRIWPGPNSNTYVDHCLRRAGLRADLHPMAVGKDYRGPWGFGVGATTTRSGLQLETPLVGAKVGVLDGVELHVLTTTFGVDLVPPAIKTPVGRFGFPE